MKGPHALKSGIWSHIWTCIWKSIVTSRIFRDPLRISFPHKTDRLAQMIQPYCRVLRTYSGMKIRDYVLCFRSTTLCVFHAAFVQTAESPHQISKNTIEGRYGHHRVDQTALSSNFTLPRVVNPCPFSTFIMKGLATTPSSFLKERSYGANTHAPKSSRVV